MTKFELLKTIENVENLALSACEELKQNIDNYTIQDCKAIENVAEAMRCDIEYIAGDMCRIVDKRHLLLLKQRRETVKNEA